MLAANRLAGVAPEVNLRIALSQESIQVTPPLLWNPGQTSPEVQNIGISGPKKNVCAPKIKKIFFYKNKLYFGIIKGDVFRFSQLLQLQLQILAILIFHHAYFLTSLSVFVNFVFTCAFSYLLIKYCTIVLLDIWAAISIYQQISNTSSWNTKQPSHLL